VTTPAAPRRLLVLSSSFNPPTRAHEAMLRLASERLPGLSPALLLTLTNVDKELFGASVDERLAMMEALAEGLGAEVLTAPRPRFLDVARYLEAAGRPDPVFLLGYDTLVRLFDRGYYTDIERELGELFSIASFVAFDRMPFTIVDVLQLLAQLPPAFRERVMPVELPHEMSHLSSTTARGRLEIGDLAAAVPESVLEVIRREGIYGWAE
jgi:nicotinamide-nucleotide adenylyltransferase